MKVLRELLEVEERRIILEVIGRTSTRIEAAKALGISREGLYKKLVRLGLHVRGDAASD